MEMSMLFANLTQATTEDHAAVTNMTTEYSTLTEQVDMYVSCLYTKKSDNMALQTAMKNL